MSAAINPMSDALLRAGVRRETDARVYAVYLKSDNLAIVGMPYRIAMHPAAMLRSAA